MSTEVAELDAAVAAARELFWAKGYDATSIEDVVQAAGVNRYALYKAFGGKRELFLAAIDSYFAQGRAIVEKAFQEPDLPPLEGVRRIFEWGAREMAQRRSGCLICNLAVEHSREDPIINERMQSYLEQIRQSQIRALTLARDCGELNPNVSPEEGADILMILKLGLGQRSRAGATFEELMATVDATLAILRSSSPQIVENRSRRASSTRNA